MPKLIRLYITSCLIGFALAAVFAAMLMWFDVGHLRGLVLMSDEGVLAVVMLVVMNGIVFAGVQFAISVMALAQDDGPSGGEGEGMRIIPVAVPGGRRRRG